jgi:hypothetical protein
VAADPLRFALVPADLELPERIRVRSLPLVSPTPLYAWSLMWRTADPHPGIEQLVRVRRSRRSAAVAGVSTGARLGLPAGDAAEVSNAT